MLVVKEFDNGLPRIAIVDVVAKARSIDDREADFTELACILSNPFNAFLTLEEFLLQLGLCDFDLNGFVDLLVVPALVIGVVLDCGREEGVDEGGLS